MTEQYITPEQIETAIRKFERAGSEDIRIVVTPSGVTTERLKDNAADIPARGRRWPGRKGNRG